MIHEEEEEEKYTGWIMKLCRVLGSFEELWKRKCC